MKRVGLAGLALVAVGCASHPAPTDQLASSVAAVRAAKEGGASDVPEAALHLKLADEQVNHAKRLMDDGDNQEAEDRANRASQDAELALAMAREKQSQDRLAHFSQNQAQGSGGESVPTGGAPTQPMNTPSPGPTGTQVSPR